MLRGTMSNAPFTKKDNEVFPHFKTSGNKNGTLTKERL